jgi:CRISPR system Cascade subunit CasD
MTQAVRFRLKAPLASWATSGLVIRTTDLTPSWSAIVGLVGAAFGWPREDPRLFLFSIEYAMAAQIARNGQRLEDYHTVQSPSAPKARARRVRTRSEELDLIGVAPVPTRARDLNTTLTRREYLADVDYEILLVPVSEAPANLPTDVAHALANPVFPLYAGRRSCLIGRLPADVVDGELDSLLAGSHAWDARLPTTRRPSVVRERRDMPLPRRQFGVRMECNA